MALLVDAIGYSIEDSLGAPLSGKEAHGPGSSPHLAEVPFQHIGSSHLLPQLFQPGNQPS